MTHIAASDVVAFVVAIGIVGVTAARVGTSFRYIFSPQAKSM